MTRPVDQAARETAANDLDTTLFVEAAAGTGKTTAPVARIVSAVSKGRARLREIVGDHVYREGRGGIEVALARETRRDTPGRQTRGSLERPGAGAYHHDPFLLRVGSA